MHLETLSNYYLPSKTSLESKCSLLLKERFHWRRLASCVSNHNEPVLRWFRYKESFSAELMRRLMAEFDLTERIVTEAKN